MMTTLFLPDVSFFSVFFSRAVLPRKDVLRFDAERFGKGEDHLHGREKPRLPAVHVVDADAEFFGELRPRQSPFHPFFTDVFPAFSPVSHLFSLTSHFPYIVSFSIVNKYLPAPFFDFSLSEEL